MAIVPGEASPPSSFWRLDGPSDVAPRTQTLASARIDPDAVECVTAPLERRPRPRGALVELHEARFLHDRCYTTTRPPLDEMIGTAAGPAPRGLPVVVWWQSSFQIGTGRFGPKRGP